MRAAPAAQQRSKLGRLCAELPSLATALPLHPSTSIFVRAHESRLDVLMIGPEGTCTPYENSCFVFDLHLARETNCVAMLHFHKLQASESPAVNG